MNEFCSTTNRSLHWFEADRFHHMVMVGCLVAIDRILDYLVDYRNPCRNDAMIVIYDYHWLPDRNWDDCLLCGEYRLINHAVAFYEEPVHEEIGTVLWHGGEVGGMSCCKECHDKHYELN